MVILSCYDKRFNILPEKVTEPSIVEPGKALPMNKLIKGVINGTIVINATSPEFDFLAKEIEVEEGKTPSSTMHAAHEAFVEEYQKQSDNFVNPTVGPGFDIIDAENISASLDLTEPSKDLAEDVIDENGTTEAFQKSEGGIVEQ